MTKNKNNGEEAKNGTSGENVPGDPLKQKDDEIKSLNGQLMRLKAEFDNYRKRVEKEKELKYIFGKQSVLLKLVDLIDIMDNAARHAAQSTNVKDIIQGIELLNKEFSSFVSKEGITKMETEGKLFDPHYHEILNYEINNDREENTILHEIQKGYMFEDGVLRPARVIVSKKKEVTDIVKAGQEQEIMPVEEAPGES